MASNGNNFGKNIGKNIAGNVGSAIGKAKSRADNGKEYDVMNPEAENPNITSAKKQSAKTAVNLIKTTGKALLKLGKALIDLLASIPVVGWIIIAILVVLLIIAVIFTAWNAMPGMMQSKLKELFKVDVSAWFTNEAVASLDDNYKDIIDVANYLEDMDYNLIGDGFVRPKLREISDYLTYEEVIEKYPDYTIIDGKFCDSSGNVVSLEYYDALGRTIDNSTGNVISDSEYTDEFGIIREMTSTEADKNNESARGKVARIEKNNLQYYRLLRTYLLSNYRIYTLKNADEGLLKTIAKNIMTISGNRDAWAKGLIKLYVSEGGIATDHWWWGSDFGSVAKFEENKLILKKGLMNKPMEFSIEGWTPRYGMSLEFLLSVHLGTHAPDMVYAMLQNFDTEIQVYLNDSGEGKIEARYVDPSNESVDPNYGVSLAKIKETLDATGHTLQSQRIVEDGTRFKLGDNWITLDEYACQDLLTADIGLVSPNSCTTIGSATKMEDNSKGYGAGGESLLEQYGITNELDSEGYSLIANAPLDADNLEMKINKYVNEVDTTDITYMMDENKNKAQELGFNLSNIGEPVIVDYEKVYKIEETIGDYNSEKIIQNGDIYRIRKVYYFNTWQTEKDGEMVSCQWPSLKYIVYKIGTFTQESTSHTPNFDVPEGYVVNGWNEPVEYLSGYYDYETTFIFEYVNRNKSMQELTDEGLVNEFGDVDLSLGKCSNKAPDGSGSDACCEECKKYVNDVIDALADVADKKYESYQPYIARVVGSWFRDTYFIVPEKPDKAIEEYAGEVVDEAGNKIKLSTFDSIKFEKEGLEEKSIESTNHPEFNVANTFGNAEFVLVDEDYLEDSGEYWTQYIMKEDDDTKYQLYYLNGDGTTSDKTMEEFLAEHGYSSKEQAEKDGYAFVKKARTTTVENFKNDGHDLGVTYGKDDGSSTINSGVLWSAYGFDSNGNSTNWTRVSRNEGNENVNKLYNDIYGEDESGEGMDDGNNSGIYYYMDSTNNVTQVEDAQRGETNPLIKYLFKYRKFYIYDGGEERAVQIEQDRERVINGYWTLNSDIKNYYYDEKAKEYKKVADEFDIKDAIKSDSTITTKNFYRFPGLIGSNGWLEKYYGSNWKKEVKDLLNKYGRSALRQSYSWATDVDQIVPEDWKEYMEADGSEYDFVFTEEELAEQWLDWQLDMYYMDKYQIDLKQYYHTDEDLLKIEYDPRDPDLIGTVEITKSSLSVFSILENSGTIDAEYAYRDFKELVVELNYFDKEDLSSKKSTVWTWLLPDVDVTGWPNRPWDKQNVDYGTLIQSKATYEALGIYGGSNGAGFDGSQNSLGSVDESKIFWIGDSWIDGLKTSGIAKSPTGYFAGYTGMNADAVDVDTLSVPSDVSALVICFGLNGTGQYNKTQDLIEKLHSKYSNIPIFVLKTSHVASGYKYVTEYATITATSFNSDIDKYNYNMRAWCGGKDYVTFVEDATKTINNGDGVLDDAYKSGEGGSGEFHLKNPDGYKVWYNDIISSIGVSGSAESSTETIDATSTPAGAVLDTTVSVPATGDETNPEETTTEDTSTPTTPTNGKARESSITGDWGIEETENPENGEHYIVANGIEYRQFDHTHGHYSNTLATSGEYQVSTDDPADRYLYKFGCGIYSSTALLSGYFEDMNPKKVMKIVHDNVNNNPDLGIAAWKNGHRPQAVNALLNDQGISGSWYNGTDKDAVKSAFETGKPMIFRVGSGAPWGTSEGHYFCVLGISPAGEVYTADSRTRMMRVEEGSDFESAFAKLWNELTRNGTLTQVWIPDNAPDGSKAGNGSGTAYGTVYFEGYSADQDVVSPVTGRILEIGKHDRVNVYTGETEEVEFITIEVINDKDYFSDSMIGSVEYETETKYSASEALNLFYREYKDICAGYVVTIDGFDVSFTEENKDGKYEKNEVKQALYNSAQTKDREEREQAKEDAPYFINFGEAQEYPGDEYVADLSVAKGYYVKEGKFIGKTIASTSAEETESSGEETSGIEATSSSIPTELVSANPTLLTMPEIGEDTSEDSTVAGEETSSSSSSTLPDKLTYTYDDFKDIENFPAEYMRIQVKDIDYAIVEDVEDFFDIPDPIVQAGKNGSSQPFNGDASEQFLYWMLVLCEGLSHDQVKQGYAVANNKLNDGTVTIAMGVTNWCNDIFWNLGYGEYMHGSHAGNTGMRVGDKIPLDVNRDVALGKIDSDIQKIKDEFPGMDFDEYQMAALLSFKYNFGSFAKGFKDAINSGDEARIRNTWSNWRSDGFGKYPGWKTRRRAEVTVFLDKKWVAPYSGKELEFYTETPFTDYFNGNFNVANE